MVGSVEMIYGSLGLGELGEDGHGRGDVSYLCVS